MFQASLRPSSGDRLYKTASGVNLQHGENVIGIKMHETCRVNLM